MNPLQQIPAAVRKWLYVAYAFAGTSVASVAVYSTATHHDVPEWSIGVAAVLAGPLALLFGATAASNVADPRAVTVSAPPAATVEAQVTFQQDFPKT